MEITTERIFIVCKNWESKHPQKKRAKHIITIEYIDIENDKYADCC